MSFVYLDTNVFIAAFEVDDGVSRDIRTLIRACEARPNFITTSEITLAELGARDELSRKYSHALLAMDHFIQLVPLSRDLLLQTCDFRIAMIGRGRKTKLADAIHCVTAQSSGCQYLLSADKRLPAPNNVERLDTDVKSLRMLRDALHA